jgi:hypothetical protein
LVSAKSLRIVLDNLLMLSVSLLAILLMALTDSDKAGKSLLWRMRRNRKSSVDCLPSAPRFVASSGSR